MHGSTKSVQRPSTFYIEIIKNTGELLTASTRGLGGGVFVLTCTLGDRLEAL